MKHSLMWSKLSAVLTAWHKLLKTANANINATIRPKTDILASLTHSALQYDIVYLGYWFHCRILTTSWALTTTLAVPDSGDATHTSSFAAEYTFMCPIVSAMFTTELWWQHYLQIHPASLLDIVRMVTQMVTGPGRWLRKGPHN